jgi:hypothetical protein
VMLIKQQIIDDIKGIGNIWVDFFWFFQFLIVNIALKSVNNPINPSISDMYWFIGEYNVKPYTLININVRNIEVLNMTKIVKIFFPDNFEDTIAIPILIPNKSIIEMRMKSNVNAIILHLIH